MTNKTKIISVVNQKGGVGKTTTVVNISVVFSLLNKKVLVIDFDPQSNANYIVGVQFVLRNNLTTLQCND